ncbi:hypothetical protein ACFQPF_09915 [Fictibacillus iocasae]|uniref:Uncharacterized protein n=1 Tax=Fictibacillus iocasae TaxID=2715437 RepID=A0ABW2NQY3_9BACL
MFEYGLTEKRNKIDFKNYVDWKAQIRKHIYLNSSDADIFRGTVGDERDIFYSVEGKGKGIWGLRSAANKQKDT